jgi:hypothetical protein
VRYGRGYTAPKPEKVGEKEYLRWILVEECPYCNAIFTVPYREDERFR